MTTYIALVGVLAVAVLVIVMLAMPDTPAVSQPSEGSLTATVPTPPARPR